MVIIRSFRYDDSLKTTGLGHVATYDVNLVQKSNKNKIPPEVQAPKDYPKAMPMDSAASDRKWTLQVTKRI